MTQVSSAALRILCFGDSNTWGYIPGSGKRFPGTQRWPGVLRQELQSLRSDSMIEVVEDGCCGRTCRHPLLLRPGTRGEAALSKLLRRDAKFDAILIALGINDLKRGNAKDADEVCEGIEMLVQIAVRHAPNTAILLIAPPRLSPHFAYDEMFSHAVETSQGLATRYVTLAERFRTTGALVGSFDCGAVIEVSAVDGIHFDAEKHRELGRALVENLTQLLVERQNLSAARRRLGV